MMRVAPLASVKSSSAHMVLSTTSAMRTRQRVDGVVVVQDLGHFAGADLDAGGRAQLTVPEHARRARRGRADAVAGPSKARVLANRA